MTTATNRPFLLGLIGQGIQASRSPRLHEGEARALGLRCTYQLRDLDTLQRGTDVLPEMLAAMQLTGFAGTNITHPCKQAVIPYLDSLSEDAAAIGAVNTVVFENGKTVGHNTDWWGFAEGFRRGLPDASCHRVVQLGAGGAGAAVAHAMLHTGTGRLAIADADPTRAQALAERLCKHFGSGRAVAVTDLADEMAAADGLIQATPIGMLGHPGMPLDPALLHTRLWVADVIYFPLETELMKAARALGCRTINGGGMVVFQAAEALRLFTGVQPDGERMLQHFMAMGD